MIEIVGQTAPALSDHTGIMIGAIATLCGGILATATALLTTLSEHRWQAKQERRREKRKQIERLMTVVSECRQRCITFHAEAKRLFSGTDIHPVPISMAMIDEAARIATLYVPECTEVVGDLAAAVTKLIDSDVAAASDKFLAAFRDVNTAVSKVNERCAEVAAVV